MSSRSHEKVKVLLVSPARRASATLTPMGRAVVRLQPPEQCFDPKDYKTARLIDIDGDAKGSIQKIDAAGRYVALEAPTDDTPTTPTRRATCASAPRVAPAARRRRRRSRRSTSTCARCSVDAETLLTARGAASSLSPSKKSKIWNAKPRTRPRDRAPHSPRELGALRAADDPPPPGSPRPPRAEGSGSSSGGGVGRHNSSSGSSASAHMANT